MPGTDSRQACSGLPIDHHNIMRVLVTGADGFVARHLVPVLRDAGHEVIGTAFDIAAAADLGIAVLPLDITNPEACGAVVRDVAPEWMVHLAAVSTVRSSLENPENTQRVNVEGTLRLLEACGQLAFSPRVLIVGSGEEYGPNDGAPILELPVEKLQPRSPYAESKAEVEKRIEAEPRFRAMTIRTRSFPHCGPGQRQGFFTADVASQLAAIAAQKMPPVLQVGNLEAVRDYTDVRDVVRAYHLLLERGTLGEVYNVCSGRGVKIRELLDELINLSRMDVRVEHDPARARPSDVPVLIGSNAKLRSVTGWEPTIPLSQTLNDILAWWKFPERAALKRGG
ncbi:MAG: GDP-D-mannose dehydratase [Parcubacteria group bacterium Gr01-1014_106]|nr:MAG: GDP-D-mannose dehydratase [Parcubacteria group bacterium Gr01-1014_106]